MSDSLRPQGLQYARLPYPSLSPRVCSNSCPLSRECHLIILSIAAHFSCCFQSFPASGSFPVSWLFSSGGQNIGSSALASVLPMNIQDWFPFWLTGLILLSKGLSGVFSVMVRGWVGKEFLDMRQNEREIKFITVGNAVRTAGQLKGELPLNRRP